MEQYAMQINIEAGVMIDMADKLLFPAGSEFAASLAESINGLKTAGVKTVPSAQLEVLEDTVIALNCLKS